MTDSSVPRLLKREFGLLYGGLFNKIRFPGRYAVDESGSKIDGSEWNKSSIDFTGDLADLYAEPDSFYIEGDNDLMLRKRKRNDDGEVEQTRVQKVGKLDLETTQAMRREFASLQDTSIQVENQVNASIAEIKGILQKYDGDQATLSNFVDALNDFVANKQVTRDDIQQDFLEQLDSYLDTAQVERVIEQMTYTQEGVDEKVRQLRNELLGYRTADINALGEPTGRALAELESLQDALNALRNTSNFSVQNLRSILDAEYAKKSYVEGQLVGVASQDYVDQNLRDFVRQSQFDDEKKNGPVATRAYVDSYTYAKMEIDNRLRDLLTKLEGTNTTINDRLLRQSKGLLKASDFKRKLENIIGSSSDLVKQFQFLNFQRQIRDRVQQTEAISQEAANETSVTQTNLERIRDSLKADVAALQDVIKDKINTIDGSETALKDLFSNITQNNVDRISQVENLITGVNAALALNGQPDSGRQFAYQSDFVPVRDELNALTAGGGNIDVLQTNVQNNADAINNNLTPRVEDVELNYLDLRSQDDKNTIISEIQTDISGYTKTQTRDFLKLFFYRNLGPPAYWPVRRDWAYFDIIKVGGNDTIGLTPNPTNEKEYTLIPNGTTTSFGRVSLHNSGNNVGQTPANIVDNTINASGNSDQFAIFYSTSTSPDETSVYIAYPLYVRTGDNVSTNGDLFRFHYDIQDQTTSTITSSSVTPQPRFYWSQTLQNYDFSVTPRRRRVDRLVPIRVSTGDISGSRFKFRVRVTAAPDAEAIEFPP